MGREPVLRRMPDGSLFCAVYSGGPTEPHDDNVVLGTRSLDDGLTWTSPDVLFRHDARGVWATELFTGGDSPCLFVHAFDAASHYLELQTFRSFYSAQTGQWSEPVSLPGGLSGVIVRQGIVLQNGSWVFPVYWQEALGDRNWRKIDKAYHPHDSWRMMSGALRSDDRGKTFTLHGNLRADLSLWEPNAVEIAPNHLVMLMRAEGTPWKYRSESRDGGLTWSVPVQSDIPCANSKVTLLSWDRRVIMLHNPSDKVGWQHRTPLSLWISDDGCKTWPVKIDLVYATIPGQAICYPHAFIDREQRQLCVAVDSARTHYFFKAPLADFEAD
ncbi:MAG: sialidase family protein [Capsulimonadaceae bacterium]|nr:sialidase family protein [Capsulimonadaceae bacterium]